MNAETAEISGVKPNLLLAVNEKHEVPGSGKRPWVIKRCEGEFYTCSCGAFQSAAGPSRKRSCAHLKAVLGDKYEEARRRLELQNKPSSSAKAATKRKAESYDNAVSLTAGISQSTPMTGGECIAEPDYEDLVASQGEKSNKRYKVVEDGIEYDTFTGSVTFNGRAKTKGYNKDTAVTIMLSESCDPDKMNPTGWWMSEKLDGVRAYWTGDRLISRSNIDWKPPKWFIDKLPKGFALDGELWRERDGFEELSGMCRRADHSAWGTINYFVFDAPDLKLPFEERIKAAAQKVPDGTMTPDEALAGRFGGRIAILRQIKCMGKDHLLNYLDEIERECGEGVMLRRPNSPYERKRSRHSLKLKSTYDAEAVVMGYTAGKGRHWGEMGSLGLGMECGTIFTCGSGLTDEMRREWQPPTGTIVRYRFSELTADHVPRFPVYMGICPDRTVPKDAVCRTTEYRMKRKQQQLMEDGERARQRKTYGGHSGIETVIVQLEDLLQGKPGGR